MQLFLGAVSISSLSIMEVGVKWPGLEPGVDHSPESQVGEEGGVGCRL